LRRAAGATRSRRHAGGYYSEKRSECCNRETGAWFQVEPQRASLTGIELGNLAQMNAGLVLVGLAMLLSK
jgi:hypothetical protein